MNNNKTDRFIVKITQWLGVIIFIGIILWGSKYLWNTQKYEYTNDAQIDAYLSPINSKLGGYIQKIYFKDNQIVHKGDTLVLIQTDEYELKKDVASAELENSQAKIDILNASEERQKRNIDVTRARISGSQAKLQYQEKEYNRYHNLLNEESTTKQKFDNVSSALKVEQSNYNESFASLRAEEAKLNDLRAERSVINAEIKMKKSILARQQLDLQYTVITAPFDGQVGKKTIQEGQLVKPEQTLAFITNGNDDKWVIANFKETQIGAFKVGQNAKIEIDAFPGETFEGTIESFSPTTGSRYSLLPPDNATGNFVKVIQRIPIRIKLNQDSKKLNKLSAGMNANVYISK